MALKFCQFSSVVDSIASQKKTLIKLAKSELAYIQSSNMVVGIDFNTMNTVLK